MTDSRPRLSQMGLWDAHRAACLVVLRRALVQLAAAASGIYEVELNRELYFCLLGATQEALKHNESAPGAPVPEGHNPPAADDTERATRERKLPDFYWPLIDHLEPDPRRCARQFVVECKRLDIPSSRSWIFTQQYVSAGVARFKNPEHGYGQDAPSGAMVGYLQGLATQDALDEVNAFTTDENLPPLLLVTTTPDGVKGVSEFDHSFTRRFPESPFHIQHLWVRMPPAQRRASRAAATSSRKPSGSRKKVA